MKVELFIDEDVHSGLAHALRKRGYDAIFLTFPFLPFSRFSLSRKIKKVNILRAHG